MRELGCLRLCVEVPSTCSSRWPERLTGSYPCGYRLRVWVEAGRNAADGTTERACYFAATCTQLHILSPRAKWMPRCFAACGGKTSGRMRGGCGATMGPGDHTVLIAFGENAPGAVEQRAENVNVPRAGREYRRCRPLSCVSCLSWFLSWVTLGKPPEGGTTNVENQGVGDRRSELGDRGCANWGACGRL